ncbi:MAG: GNAT family N-acetyltransferase [Bacteroidales bacterium]|nr:GNAT family N-acetyltransferase [Bacteroidales bacterium]
MLLVVGIALLLIMRKLGKSVPLKIRKYTKSEDEAELMQMILDEDGWDYADENLSEKYKSALETSITYVAYKNNVLCGYSRSLEDFGTYIYICDLLVKPDCRGGEIGRKLMECIRQDYPNRIVYVMSGVDGYYEKLGYKRVGSIFEL